MKKTMLFVSALVATSAVAREISSDEASRAAAAWVRRDAAPLGTSIASATTAEVHTARGDGDTPIYHTVRMAGGGVVVTSAESGVTPVVAFFDGDVPAGDNLIWKILDADMALRTRLVLSVRAAGGTNGMRSRSASGAAADPFGAEEAAWAELLADEKLGRRSASIDDASGLSDLRVAPLVSTTWGQFGNAANYYTPPGNVGDPDNYPCGCVALAGAQIAKFWQFPTASCPPVERLCFVDSVPQTFRTMGGTYDWANMPADFSALSTVQKQAIGKLCYDMGVATLMNWEADNASTLTILLADAFREVFGYASAMSYLHAEAAMPANFVERTILANLDAKRPVVLNIAQHAVVADGYGYASGTLYTHLNLGWGGAANAWYNLPEVDTASYGGSYVSTVLNGAVYNIHPTETGELLTGRVLDGNGDPVGGATVTATCGTNAASATTDEKGIYAICVPGGRTWSVSATALAQSGSRSAYVWLSNSAVCIERNTIGGLVLTGVIGNSWGNDITLGVDVPAISFNDALDAPTLAFTTGGSAEWLTVTSETHDGEDAAQSGSALDSMDSWMEATVGGPGTISFWWNVSSEEGYDWLEFYVDGALDSRISGTNATWALKEVEISGGGIHTLRWRYVKDEGAAFGADCGWVDQVVWAQTGDLFVDAANGSDGNDGLSWSSAKASIQAAIDIVEADFATNAVILVADGCYEPITATNNIPFSICSVNGSDAAIIDGSLQWARGVTNRCATLGSANSHTNTIISGFTFTNGVAQYGGGSYCGKLENCRVAGNTASSMGGGAYRAALEDCDVSGNSANYGGGLYMGSANRCTISGNTANSSGGGANSVPLTRCVVTNNTAGYYGGGAMSRTLNFCTVVGNIAGQSGGGTYSAALTDCTVSDNVATNYGGGVYNGSATRCGIVKNRAITKNGGGAHGAVLENCVVVYNEAQSQDGVYGGGGGVSGSTLTNCTVFANSAYSGGGVKDSSLVNCIVWGNSAGKYPNVLASSSKPCLYSCLGEAVSGDMHVGNIVADPLFVDGVHGDYHLQINSPCINAGTNELVAGETDFYGDRRIVGKGVDMGASEFQVTGYSSWATVWDVTGAAAAETEGVPNLIRYVFDRPGGECNPFTGITFNEQGRPVIHTLVPVNTGGVTVKVLSTTNLADWANAEWKPLTIESGGTLVFEADIDPVRFYKLTVE